MAETYEIGKQLVELCKQGKAPEAIEKLYAPNIISIEAMASPNFPQRLEGIAAVKGKNEWWEKNHEVHRADAKGPFPHGDRFIVFFNFEVTPKAGPMAGKRMNLEEGALYSVKNGKITQEEFFYQMG